MVNSDGVIIQLLLWNEAWLGNKLYLGFSPLLALRLVISLLEFAIDAEKCTFSFEDDVSVLPVFPPSFVLCSFTRLSRFAFVFNLQGLRCARVWGQMSFFSPGKVSFFSILSFKLFLIRPEQTQNNTLKIQVYSVKNNGKQNKARIILQHSRTHHWT